MHFHKEATDVGRLREFRKCYSGISKLNPSALIFVKYPLEDTRCKMFPHFAQSVVKS